MFADVDYVWESSDVSLIMTFTSQVLKRKHLLISRSRNYYHFISPMNNINRLTVKIKVELETRTYTPRNINLLYKNCRYFQFV